MTTKLEQKFKEMSAAQRVANFGALDYIKCLASNTGTNISRWNIIKFFGQDDGVNLITDKRTINKIFFERLQQKNNDEEPEEVSYDGMEKIEKEFIKFIKTTRLERKNHIESTIKTLNEGVRGYYAEIERRLAKTVKLSAELITISDDDSIAKSAEELLKEVNSVIKEGLWTNPVVEDGILYLNTPNNIVLSNKNKSANVDYQVDMGQLAIKIDFAGGDFRVIPYKNNLSYQPVQQGGRYYHPHVYPDGRVCLGNAQETIVKHITNFEYGKALRIFHALLHLYNDGSPIVCLNYFRNAPKMVYRLSEGLKHPDRKKKPADDGSENTPAAPVFRQLDVVEFEFATPGHTAAGEPRWDHHRDRGSSGNWGVGVVTKVDDDTIVVRNQPNDEEWEWYNVNHPDYDPAQWSRPGFLRHQR